MSLHRIYTHKLMSVNFTTYDVRRDQDIIHVDTPQCNVMLLDGAFTQNSGSHSSAHPYLYAKILKICHASVSYIGFLPDGTKNETAHRLDFAWIHWYDFHDSKDQFSLDQLTLQPLDSGTALGFLDPSDIVWCAHLIPRFSLGPSESKAPRSKCLPKPNEDTQWKSYYVNRLLLSLHPSFISPLLTSLQVCRPGYVHALSVRNGGRPYVHAQKLALSHSAIHTR